MFPPQLTRCHHHSQGDLRGHPRRKEFLCQNQDPPEREAYKVCRSKKSTGFSLSFRTSFPSGSPLTPVGTRPR